MNIYHQVMLGAGSWNKWPINSPAVAGDLQAGTGTPIRKTLPEPRTQRNYQQRERIALAFGTRVTKWPPLSSIPCFGSLPRSMVESVCSFGPKRVSLMHGSRTDGI
jgi:hypothetical protein